MEEIYLDNYLLCSGRLTDGRVGPSGGVLNGQSIEDKVFFFRALKATLFDRGGEEIEWSFRVARFFATNRLAGRFEKLHRQDIPRQGRIKVTVGDDGDSEDIYLEDAIVQPTFPQRIGTCVIVNYVIKGGIFTTDVPDEPLPSPDPEEENPVTRFTKVVIDEGEDEVEVTFSAPFPSAPIIPSVNVTAPAGQPAIGWKVVTESITTEGFTVTLDAATPAEGYELHYLALKI